MATSIVDTDFVQQKLSPVVGTANVLLSKSDKDSYLREWRGRYTGDCMAVLRPGTTQEVAAIVQFCAAEDIAIIPQGGNTGLCGGAVPLDKRSILINLSRMKDIRNIDPANYTMTVEAGCILKNLQDIAEEHDRLFPLSLGAEGSCMIGGNLSTNAGGILTLRYGNARDLVLGLEVVLPDGQIWNGLRRLRKNNTGYDLKNLFLGAEGTLGIITAAVLKLFPLPPAKETVLAAIPSVEASIALLSFMRGHAQDQISAFELIPQMGFEMCQKHLDGITNPFQDQHPWYVLINMTGNEPESLRQRTEDILAAALEDGLVTDAVIAENESQRAALWRVREEMPIAAPMEGGDIHHDVAVPVSDIPAFIQEVAEAAQQKQQGARIMPFGHVGDGNIHYTIFHPEGHDAKAFKAKSDDWHRMVHDIAMSYNGSFSAEHGIGLHKRAEFLERMPDIEVEMMRGIKKQFDPQNIMNPGKIL